MTQIGHVPPDDNTEEPAENPSLPPEDSPGEAGVKHLNADVKNLYIGGNLLNIWGKASLHRSEKDTLGRQQQTDTNSNNSVVVNAAQEKDVVVARLLAHGISRTVAHRLARTYSVDYLTLKQEYLEFLQSERPDELKKPAAWLRKAIEDDYGAPDGFISREEGEQHVREEKRQAQAALEALQRDRDMSEAQKHARNEAWNKWRLSLQHRFGTTVADEEAWTRIIQELRYGGMDLADLSKITDAEILSVSDNRLQLGIAWPTILRELQHPAYLKRLQRAAQAATGKALEVTLVAIDPPPVSGN